MNKELPVSCFMKCLLLLLINPFLTICSAGEIIGSVRVQVLSPTLVRIELKGPKGFEDRPTFHMTERNWPGSPTKRSSAGAFELIQTDHFVVKIPSGAQSLKEIVITNPNDEILWSMPPADEEGDLPESLSTNRHWLPGPHEHTRAWAIADTPRYVPASSDESWGGGYNIAPSGIPDNGWDLNNDAPDIYVFLPQGDNAQLRKDFITLTGRTDMIPLCALGGWDSRYYPYNQTEALEKIDTYRTKHIPLDVFVVDTDWRVGASHGYGVNTDLFPDMQKFIRDAHAKNVRIVFNDHPEPQGDALDANEVQYRNKGLRSKFDIGLDTWWYDRNWHTAIKPPAGINKEVFGMYIYHWITQDYYPDRRPFIMANVDGIDNGHINRPPDIAAHRYNMQWTGDTTCDDASLKREVKNAVYSGVYTPFAYVSTDVGGHVGIPSTEQYCRWVQFGAMSPIFRLHCTRGVSRNPWDYDEPAEDVVRDYVRMRMRLLPVFYTAARNNYDTGAPILKRCDLKYPGYQQAHSDYQYLLGDNILVAPILNTVAGPVPSDWLENGRKAAGLTGHYFDNTTLSGNPKAARKDAEVNFSWGTGNPADGLPNDNFSIRWTGDLTIKAGHNVKLGLVSDDGCRLWINGELVIDQWIDRAETTTWAPGIYKDGQTYVIEIEYYEASGQAACRLVYENADRESTTQQELWIPPGTWTNVWTGDKIHGPQMYTASVSIRQMPIFVKEGAIIPLAPDMAYTGQKAWDPMTLDIYPDTRGSAAARLYEDDGFSNAYKSGHCRTTEFQALTDDAKKQMIVTIKPAQGTYTGALSERSWVLRLRPPAGWSGTPERIIVDGTQTSFKIIPQNLHTMPFTVTDGTSDMDIIEIRIPTSSVTMKRTVVLSFAQQ